MPWARLEDRFPAHRKVRRLSDAAFRLHVSAICWCAEQLTDGVIADSEIGMVSDVKRPRAAAAELERAGLWHRTTREPAENEQRTTREPRENEPTWVIHDYTDYNPSREQVIKERAQKTARQQRWRERKAAAVDGGVDASTDTSTDASVDRLSRARVPDPTRPVGISNEIPNPSSSEPAAPADADSQRPDVEEICRHMADAIEANGSRRPVITKAWRTAARLLLDKDGRTVDQVHTAIDWCQTDEFWRGNVLSMPTLRRQYDRLRLAASRGNRATPGATRPSTTDQRVSDALTLAQQLAAEDGNDLGQLLHLPTAPRRELA